MIRYNPLSSNNAASLKGVEEEQKSGPGQAISFMHSDFFPSDISDSSLHQLMSFIKTGNPTEKKLSGLAHNALVDGYFTQRNYKKNDIGKKYTRRFTMPGEGDVELAVHANVNDACTHDISKISLTFLASGQSESLSFENSSCVKYVKYLKPNSGEKINLESKILQKKLHEDLLRVEKNFRPLKVLSRDPALAGRVMSHSQINSSNRLYKTREEFVGAITELVNEAATFSEMNMGLSYGRKDLETLDYAWHAYSSAKNIKSALILGRHYEGIIIPSCNESFPCVDEELIANLGLTSNTSDAQKAGGVFLFDPATWSLAVNDAFMLGAIHYGQDIFFASHLSQKNIWLPDEHRLTVTGRELISLHASNRYKMLSGGNENNTGNVAQFNHAHEESFFGFAEYLFNIRKYLTYTDLLNKLC